MGLRVKPATTPGEIRDLLRVRHQVFVREDGFLPEQGGVIVDLYDALPSTVNLVAVVDGGVSGGIRITKDSEAGMPADAFFDFRAVLPSGAQLASCSMMCLLRSTRYNTRLLVGMLRMSVYWARAKRLSHLCGPVNPAAQALLTRVGFAPVGEPFEGPSGLPSVPMAMDLSRMSPDYLAFVERQDVGLWMDSFERAFFETGEAIVVEGEPGDDAYLVVDGVAVAIAHGTGPDGPEVARFERGAVFGELALLTERPRSTTVVAAAPTDVMVLHKSQFWRQLETSPELAMRLMRSMGDRFHDAVINAPPRSGEPSDG